MAILRARLRGSGAATFRALVADCESTLEVVGRFLGLLELYREGVVAFDQAAALAELRVRWTGHPDDDEADEAPTRSRCRTPWTRSTGERSPDRHRSC